MNKISRIRMYSIFTQNFWIYFTKSLKSTNFTYTKLLENPIAFLIVLCIFTLTIH